MDHATYRPAHSHLQRTLLFFLVRIYPLFLLALLLTGCTPAERRLYTIIRLTIYGVLFFVPVVLIALTGMWEKRRVWPFIPANEMPAEMVPEPNEYHRRAYQDATSFPVQSLGTFGNGNGKMYKVRTDFLIAPGADLIISISSGSLAKIPVKGTVLCTPLADGRFVMTTDNMAAVEVDLIGNTLSETIVDAPFAHLLNRHQARILATGGAIAPFSFTDPLGDYRARRLRHLERLVEKGLAHFLTAERAQWKYTPRGAVLFAIRGQFRQPRTVKDTPVAATGIQLPPQR